MRNLKSTIKVVKRDQKNQQTNQEPEPEPETKQTPKQSTREMIVTVRRWISELRERKVTVIY